MMRFALALAALLVLATSSAGAVEGLQPPTSQPLQLIVQYRASAPATANQAQSALGVRPRAVDPLDRIRPGKRILEFHSENDLQRALARLRTNPDVEYVDRSERVTATFVPNDPNYPQQYDKILQHLDVASDLETGDPNVVVLVSDTAFDCTLHPDLLPNCRQDLSRSFISDPTINKHGYHVAGIAAAAIDNGVGIAGSAGTASIAFSRFLNGSGSGSSADGLKTWQHALELDAQGYTVVLNNSWGGGGFQSNMQDAAMALRAAGVINVAAAGNNHADNCATPFYPAAYADVIAAASTDQADALSSFSNYGVCADEGRAVELAAPGSNILSTCEGSTYCSLSGTSMAAPQVAGAVALIRSQDPDADYLEILDRLTEASVPLNLPVVSGGRIDLPGALQEPAPGIRVSLQCATPNEVNQESDYLCQIAPRGVGGFEGDVGLACSGVPAAACVIMPPTVPVGQVATLRLTPSRQTPAPVTYSIVVDATSEVGDKQTQSRVTVWPFGTEDKHYVSTEPKPLGKPCFNCPTVFVAETSIFVPDSKEILRLSVDVHMNWFPPNELKITMISASGTAVVVKPFGTSGPTDAHYRLTTDVFNGQNIAGNWTIRAELKVDTIFKGYLNGWTMDIKVMPSEEPPPPPPPETHLDFVSTEQALIGRQVIGQPPITVAETSIDVPHDRILADLSGSAQFTWSMPGQMQIALISPVGTVAILKPFRTQGSLTHFRFEPDLFNGENIMGRWTLRAQVNANTSVKGSLNGWSMFMLLAPPET